VQARLLQHRHERPDQLVDRGLQPRRVSRPGAQAGGIRVVPLDNFM
ncbi:MAG: hypothetical protein, partial [Olavius algarvensis Gamma 1 endosymbiont]